MGWSYTDSQIMFTYIYCARNNVCNLKDTSKEIKNSVLKHVLLAAPPKLAKFISVLFHVHFPQSSPADFMAQIAGLVHSQ